MLRWDTDHLVSVSEPEPPGYPPLELRTQDGKENRDFVSSVIFDLAYRSDILK